MLSFKNIARRCIINSTKSMGKLLFSTRTPKAGSPILGVIAGFGITGITYLMYKGNSIYTRELQI